MAKKTGIELALKQLGNSTNLAEAIGNVVTRQAVELWKKKGFVPAWCAPDLMVVTGIPVEKLCPGVNWKAVRNFKAK